MAQPNFYKKKATLKDFFTDIFTPIVNFEDVTTGEMSVPDYFKKMFSGTDLLKRSYWNKDTDVSEMSDYVASQLSEDSEALAYWNSLTEEDKRAQLSNFLKDSDDPTDWSGTQYYDVDEYVQQLQNAEADYALPDKPTSEDYYSALENDQLLNDYLDELNQSEQRQTNLFENQLQENQMMFDDYRSQILGNQYRQNAQLLGTVGSEMDRARRNALEAGASAGLRMAENINTTLAMQNKQSQISLETSNQLAQQLLNQRQAAAGIRSNYNDMLSNNVEKRAGAKESAYGRVKSGLDSDYQSAVDNLNTASATDLNPVASGYYSYQQRKSNKSQSQYN